MNLKTLIVSAVAVTHNNLVDGALETKGGQTGSINLATSSLHTHTQSRDLKTGIDKSLL